MVEVSTRYDSKTHGQLVGDGLQNSGFRLHYNACAACNACVPLRIDTKDYPFSRSERRTLNRNADLNVSLRNAREIMMSSITLKDHYSLYQDHSHLNFGPENLQEKFVAMLKRQAKGLVLDIRDPNGRLAAGAICSLHGDVLSGDALYYNIHQRQRGLGNLIYLKLIELAESHGYRMINIGSWVPNADSGLDYKQRFHNLEARTTQGWEPFDPAIHTRSPDWDEIIVGGYAGHHQVSCSLPDGPN